MATIRLHETTIATPEQFLAGLTDFGPGRSKLFGDSADEYFAIHDEGPDQADVTEGSAGIWERLHYDWSDPRRIVMTTTDSNVWEGRSGYTYTLTRQPDGRTSVDVMMIREGRTPGGGCSRSCSKPSASAPWPDRWPTPSKPSKPATTRRSRPSRDLRRVHR